MIIIKSGTPVKVKHPVRGTFEGEFACDFEVYARATAAIATKITVETLTGPQEVEDVVPCVLRECEMFVGKEDEE